MGADISSAEWTKREGLRALTLALGADHIRWVGGAIRDSQMGLPVNDVDCATLHRPDAVIELCKKAGIRTVPTGIDHGTVTAILPDSPVEITTLRRDVSTDGRRATVEFADRWEEDAARRDFTINALYAHPETLEISDYFGGLGDLRERRVRFIGDARDRIREDHLRILRYYRFQARFGAELDEQAEEACAELAPMLKGLSRERIAMELLGILGLTDPTATVARMHRKGVLGVILPEACKRELAVFMDLISAEDIQGFTADPVRRLGALLPALIEVAETVAARLRLSRSQRAHLVALAERKEGDLAEPFALAYREGRAIAIGRILLQGGNAHALKEWNVPQFPLKGGEIVARGITAGPAVAGMLRAIEDRWISENFPDDARVTQMLDEALSNFRDQA